MDYVLVHGTTQSPAGWHLPPGSSLREAAAQGRGQIRLRDGCDGDGFRGLRSHRPRRLLVRKGSPPGLNHLGRHRRKILWR
jgi:hypothetical protein